MNGPQKRPRHVKVRIGCAMAPVIAMLAILALNHVRTVNIRDSSPIGSCWENLTKIQGAKEQWAIDFGQPAGARPTVEDLAPSDGSGYMKYFPVCSKGRAYEIGPIGEPPRCDSGLPEHSVEARDEHYHQREQQEANSRSNPMTK